MASFSTWVQLIRNFACNVRTLTSANLWLNRPQKGLLLGLNNKKGISLTSGPSYLETYAIAPTQYLATVFNVMSGAKDVFQGCNDVLRLSSWTSVIPRRSNPSTAEKLVYTSLRNELFAAYLKIVQGLILLSFAACFVVLGTGTLKGLGYFDGVSGQAKLTKYVVDSLIIMDIGLLYFLWAMWTAYSNYVSDETRCNKLAELLDKADGNVDLVELAIESGYTDSTVSKALTQAMPTSYSPSWLQSSVTPSASELVGAVEETEDILDSFSDGRKKSAPGDISAAKMARSNAAYKLRLVAYESSSAAPMALVYFLLNFCAGYGYMLGILAYYFKDQQSLWHSVLKFGFSHKASDWWGNLAGDMAWTIEPILVIVAAYLSSGSLLPSTDAAESNIKVPQSSGVRFAASTPMEKPRGRLAQAPTPWRNVGSASPKSRSKSPASRSKSPASKRGTPKVKKA